MAEDLEKLVGELESRPKKEPSEWRPVMDALETAGGGRFRPEDDIVQQGKRIVIPEGMSLSKAARFIMMRVKQDEEIMTFTHKYRYRPFDGAVCTWRALKQVFGMVALQGFMGFFGRQNANMVDVPIGVNQSESVPWGEFSLPAFDNTILYPGTWRDDEMGPLYELTVNAPRKYKSHVEGIFKLVDEQLRTSSIYRGKAFDGQEIPEFLDLTGVDPEKVVYGEETRLQLDANVWSVLRYRDELARAGISRKRSALLHGKYGTGKTLGGFLTAQVAVESGWTFIYARPAKDDMDLVLQTARLYQPACVFFEDLDTVADPDRASTDGATKLLDMFDGITAKGTEILIVLTTNHPDRIHKGMLRPGRLDAVIEIGALDEHGVRKLIEGTLPAGSFKVEDINWTDVFSETGDMLPAYIKEVADRAYRYALTRTGLPEAIDLTTEDFVHSARGLQPQLQMMDEANDPRRTDSLAEALGNVVEKTVVDTLEPANQAGELVKPSAIKRVTDREGKQRR